MRTAAVTADLDGKRDDGQRGEGDTIGTDVENLTGGTGSQQTHRKRSGQLARGRRPGQERPDRWSRQ